MTNEELINAALYAASKATGIHIDIIKSAYRKREVVAARVIYSQLLAKYPIALVDVSLPINLKHDSIIYYRSVFGSKWYNTRTGTPGFIPKYDKALRIFERSINNEDIEPLQAMIDKIDSALSCYTPRQVSKAYIQYHKRLVA